MDHWDLPLNANISFKHQPKSCLHQHRQILSVWVRFLDFEVLTVSTLMCSLFELQTVISIFVKSRAQENIFLLGSKPSNFHYTLHTFFSFPNKPPHSIPLPFFLSPSFPSSLPFLSFPFLSLLFPFLLFVFPFFLPGKFEHFSYHPCSAATTLLR